MQEHECVRRKDHARQLKKGKIKSENEHHYFLCFYKSLIVHPIVNSYYMIFKKNHRVFLSCKIKKFKFKRETKMLELLLNSK